MTPSLDHNTWVTTLLWAKQMKSLESNETITSSQLKIIVIYMWEITCFLHNNFQLSEIVSGVWEMRNFKKFDCLVFCSIIATRPSDKSTVTATRPVWLCHSSGTIGRWFWRPLLTKFYDAIIMVSWDHNELNDITSDPHTLQFLFKPFYILTDTVHLWFKSFLLIF